MNLIIAPMHLCTTDAQLHLTITLVKSDVHSGRRLKDDIALEARKLIHATLDPLVCLQDTRDGVPHLGESELLAYAPMFVSHLGVI